MTSLLVFICFSLSSLVEEPYVNNVLLYQAKTLTMGYMRWANSDTPYLGKNIRSLFKSITSYNGYLKRLVMFWVHWVSCGSCISAGTVLC